MTIHPADRLRKAFREFVACNTSGSHGNLGRQKHHSNAASSSPTLHTSNAVTAEDANSASVGMENEEVMLETTLVRDGMYCGRRFALDGFNLVYFAEEQQVKLYNQSGNIERRCSVIDFYRDYLREDHDHRRAA